MKPLRLALFAALSPCAWAQSGPHLPADSSVITVDVNVVNVLCSVRDRRGAFVTDLEKEDFQIREDGAPQQIRYFSREVNTPITVAMLLDVSGSVRRILETEKDATSRFFTEVLRPNDRALLVTFAQTVAVWQDLTSNLEQLKAALAAAGPFDPAGKPEFRAHGGTLLNEAVDLVAEKKLAGLPGRKALVIISDGVDNGSTFAAEAAVKAAQQSDVVVYAIQYADRNALSENDAIEAAAALKRMAAPTGGRVFRVNSGVPLKEAFDTIRDEMRSQYNLGYTPSNGAKDGSYRRLEVKSGRSGIRIQTRAGYYR